MRVLIVNSNRERSPWPVPPIGACAIASAAREAGHEVELLDLCFSRCPERAIRQAMARHQPETVGISVRNIDNVDWQAPKFYLEEVRRRVVEPCKAEAGCPVVLGGPAAGIMPAEMLEYFGADYVVRGDGEVALPALLAALERGGPLPDVPGLAYRTNGHVEITEPARVPDLDDLPMPRPHEWLDLPRYLAYNGSLGIQTKRGCALKCSYCVYNEIEGPCYRRKSPERVAREVADAVEAGATSIEFVDSTFNIPLDHALGICRVLAEGRIPAQFNTMGINPGAVTEELFRLLGDAGFTEVSITPETASPKMLQSLGKNFTVDDVARAAELARRCRMPIVWYFMFGGAGETAETVRETLAFAERHIPSSHLVMLVSGVRIFKGAPIEGQARRAGQLGPEDSLLEPVWYEPAIPREELFRLLDEALMRYPNYIALQDNQVPRPVLRAATALHRFFRSRRPLWSYLKNIRRVQTALGLPTHLMAGHG